ncbi:Cna B-type domain-containing protein [Streptococcus pluranimalium]
MIRNHLLTMLKMIAFVALVLGGILTIKPAQVKAAEVPVNLTATLTKFQGTRQLPADAPVNENTSLQLHFEASLPNNTAKAGDTTVIHFPKEFNILSSETKAILDRATGATIGTLTADPATRTITVVYNDFVEKNSNVSYTIDATLKAVSSEITEFGTKNLNITSNGQVVQTPSFAYEAVTKGDQAGEDLAKYGWMRKDNQDKDYIAYEVRVNSSKKDLSNLVLRDQLGTGGVTYDKNSFVITKGTYVYDSGAYKTTGFVAAQAGVDYTLTISEDGKSFNINFGNTSQGYFVKYRGNIDKTVVTRSQDIQNTAVMTADEIEAITKVAAVRYSTIDVEGQGDSPAKVQVTASKTLTGKTLEAGEFSFSLTADTGEVYSAQNAADGSINFPDLTFTKEGTYRYTMTEVVGDAVGVTYDETAYPVVIEVTKEANAYVGKITSEAITFKNSYSEPKPAVTSIKATKKLTGRDLKAGEFQFILTAADGTIYQASNQADGSITFPELTFEAEGDYYFTLSEVVGNDPEISYDNKQHKITISVTKENGELVAKESSQPVSFDNTYQEELIDVSGSKIWSDNSNQDGKRPESVTINLLANGQKVDQKVVSGQGDEWAYRFDNLPKYQDGQEIIYTVTEDSVTDYTTEISGFDITNIHAPGKTSVTVSKVWDDANNQDGKRPATISLQLTADGKASGEVVILSEDNNWTYTWSDLDQKANKQDIVYAVEEAEVDGYISKVSPIKDGNITLTNSYAPETTSISVNKVWDDAENQDGKRPASLEVALVKDGQITDQKLVLTAANHWSASFNNLPKFTNGVEIAYSVSEVTVPEGYTASEPVLTEEGSWSLTNTYSPEVTNITGQKTWDDADNQDGKRPESITVNLLADGQEVAEQLVDAASGWTYAFENLPKFKDGQEIVYTITEDAVANYAVTQDGYNLTNSYTPGKTSVTVSKVWDDASNQDGLRPDKVTVQLYADDEKSGSEVTLSAENGWAYTWSDLALKAKGKDIAYTVKEVSEVEGYTSDVSGDQVTGFTITNRHKVSETAVSGQKTWEDKNDQYGKRPESITVNLLADGQEVAEKTVTAEDDWKYSFEGLPKFKDGQEIVYTITEDAVANYSVTQDGYNLTNSYTPGKTSVTVSKVWDDANNQDGLRPDSIEVQLYANGEKSGDAVVLSKDNNWTYIWNELDLKADKKEIVYSVSEISDVKGYQKTVSSVENGQAVIINHHVPTKPEGPGQTPPTPPSSTEDKKSSDKAPKLVKDIKKAIRKVLPSTGENSSILGFVGMGILALLAYYIIKRRKA